MFAKKHKAVNAKLDDVNERILDEMLEYGPDSVEFLNLLEELERVTAVQAPKGKPREVNWDTVILVAGNLLGILVIVAYEQKHVMTSKSLGFILKPK